MDVSHGQLPDEDDVAETPQEFSSRVCATPPVRRDTWRSTIRVVNPGKVCGLYTLWDAHEVGVDKLLHTAAKQRIVCRWSSLDHALPLAAQSVQ